MSAARRGMRKQWSYRLRNNLIQQRKKPPLPATGTVESLEEKWPLQLKCKKRYQSSVCSALLLPRASSLLWGPGIRQEQLLPGKRPLTWALILIPLYSLAQEILVHTRGLKIAWPTGIYRLKTEHFPGSAAVILKMQIFFFSIPTEAWGIGTQGHEAQGSICSMLSWGEAITAILEVSKCLARVLEKNAMNANTTSERHPQTRQNDPQSRQGTWSNPCKSWCTDSQNGSEAASFFLIMVHPSHRIVDCSFNFLIFPIILCTVS